MNHVLSRIVAATNTAKYLLPLVFLSHCCNAEFIMHSDERVIAQGWLVTETYWRSPVEPLGEYDVVGLHRYQLNKNDKLVMLYLPGTNMNGELSVMDENHNLWLFLANRGVKVYTLDYRTHAVPNDQIRPFGFMKNWGIDQFVNDAALALDFINRTEIDLPVYIAGFSRGVSYAYGLIGQRKAAGLIALDGSFKRYQATEFNLANALNRLDKSEEYASVLSRSRGWANRQALMRKTWQDPNGPALTSRYVTVGEQLTSTLYNAWGKGGLTNPVDNISSITVLAKMMENYDRFFPAIQNIQGQSLSSQRDDPSTTLDDHYGQIDIPILYFGTTNLGAESLMNGIYSASKSGSLDVTINVLENHGHLDVLIGNQAKGLVYQVILDWMRARST